MTGIEIVALTLLHFVWQGALIHAVLAVLLGIARPRSANVRYVMGVAALVLMAAAPVATALRLATGASSTTAFRGSPSALSTALAPQNMGATLDPTPTEAVTPAVRPQLDNTLRGIMGSVPPLVAQLTWMMPWLVALWLTGVIALAIRLLGGWLRLRALVASGWVPESNTYGDIVERLRNRLRVSRAVRVLESALVRTPAVIGWLRPVLLIPASMSSGLTSAQLETIIAHELAHIRRHDYAVNLLQSLIETVLFYHPAVWLVSSRIRQEREHCCDDLAVVMSGDARLYASALLELETQRLGGTQLAMAATGGNLLHRVHRLLTPSSVGEGAESSRWFAGVLVLAAVLLVGSGARLLRADVAPSHTSDAPNDAVRVDNKEVRSDDELSPPDTLLVYRGSESLDARWRWAHAAAREARQQRYWIGYVVEGDVSRGWIYFDRNVPVRASGNTMISGRLRMKEFSGLVFSGTKLDSLVSGPAASDVAILVGFVMRDGRAVLDRVHAGNFVFPVQLDSRALVWLGESSDEASVALAQQLFNSVSERRLREDIAGIVGVHANSDIVRPVLSRWLESEDDDDLRAEVVEWLGEHADARTLGLLARTARTDRASRVRAEAAETIGETELPSALDTLIAMTETLTDQNARREAVEAFGGRSEARAVDALRQIVERDESSDIKREAVETLGEIETERAMNLIMELARSNQSSEVRREAVETLGERMPIDDLIRVLSLIIEEDRDVDVQREAVETLGEHEDRRIIELLTKIAEGHREPDVQREATESLGHAAPVREARTALERLVRTHPSKDVRREAIETLSELIPQDSGAVFFGSVVQGNNDADLQMTALEALSDMKGAAALDVILEAARAHPNRQVRRKAIELLGESDDPRARAMLERILTRP
jgi:beta-lactamase regulating signal transducer with metallopeptidase domain/HEAT repeat protein